MFAKEGDGRVFVSQNGLMDSGQLHAAENYRMRLINAHFDDSFYNISFSAYFEAVPQPDGKMIYVEYDPSSSPECIWYFI